MTKVLVVDDEKSITSAYVNVLNSRGFDTKGAYSCAEAFSALEAHKPDILILDLNLREELTGVDVLKKAVEINPDIKTVVVTGLGNGPLVDQSMRLGAKKVISKPTSITNMLEIINELSKKE